MHQRPHQRRHHARKQRAGIQSGKQVLQPGSRVAQIAGRRLRQVQTDPDDNESLRSLVGSFDQDATEFLAFPPQVVGPLEVDARVQRFCQRQTDGQRQTRQIGALQGVTVLDLTALQSNDRINHDLYAQSPTVVRLIGDRLIRGQVITDQSVDVLSPAEALGSAAGMVVSAPILVFQAASSN